MVQIKELMSLYFTCPDAKLLVSNAPVVAEKGQLGTAQTATVEIAHKVLLTS